QGFGRTRSLLRRRRRFRARARRLRSGVPRPARSPRPGARTMTPELANAVAARLGRTVVGARALHGGDIHSAYRIELDRGDAVFVKSSPDAPRGMFTEEARGLAWLRDAGALAVPEVIAVGDGDDGPRFLALEYLEPGKREPNFDDKLGQGLA